MLIELQATHSLCPLTRSLPLGSPFGPTFGCSISKAPPFRLWLILLNSGVDETAANKRQRAPIDAARELAREMCFQKCAGVVHGRDDRAPLFCAATRFEKWEGSSSSHDPLFSREAAFLFYAKAASPRKWVAAASGS